MLEVLDSNWADDRKHLREDLELKFKKEHFKMSEFSYESMGKLIHFLYHVMIEIIEKPYDRNSDVTYKHDTLKLLEESLN